MAGKPIDVISAMVSLGLDPEAAARVQREINREAGAIQSRLDKLNSTKAQKSMELWAEAVKQAGGVEKLTAEQTARLVAEVERLAKSGAKIPVALQPAIAATNKMREAEQQAVEEMARRVEMDKIHTQAIIENRARMAQAASDASKRMIDMDRAHTMALAEDAKRTSASNADGDALKQGLLDKAGLGALAGAGPAAAALVAAGAMAGVAKQTYELIDATAEHADNVANLATQYQISTDAVQKFQFMADRSGTSIDTFGAAIVNVTKNLDEAPEKFTKWGMSVEHLRSLRPDELLGAMSEKLQSLNDSDRLTFAKELLKGTELLPVLVDGFGDLAAKADEFGVALSEADISNLKDLREDLDDIGTAWDDMWMQIGASLAQDADVRAFFDSLRDGIVELAKLIRDNKDEIVGFAKMLAGMAGMNPGWAVKGAMQMMGIGGPKGPAPVAGLGGPVPYFQPGVTSNAPLPGLGAGGYSVASDVRQALAAKAELDKATADKSAKGRKELEAKIEAENAWYLAGMKNAEATAKAAAEMKKWMAQELIKLSDQVTKDLMPGAAEASRLMAINALPPGSLRDPEAIKALGLKVLASPTYSDGRPKQYDLGAPPSIKETAGVRFAWREFLQDATNLFQTMGKSGAAIAKIVGGVGGVASMFGDKGALEGVTGLKSLFSGGKSGDALKSVMGGLTAGFAAFDIGKTIYSMFAKTEAQKVAFDVGRDYGVKISEGLSQEIAKNSKTMGREAASLLSLDKIIGEAGGVKAFGVDKTTAKLRDLFSMIETGRMTTEQARGPFDKLFGEVAQASISKTTGLVSLQVKELMALNAASGMGSEAVDKFRNEQRAIADGILARLANNKSFTVANAGAGEAFGAALAAQYNRYLSEGLSGFEIAEKLGPQIDALQKKFDESGFGGGEAFDAMLGKVELFRSEITGPTAQALQDVTALAAALYNSGDLTRSQFQGLASQVGAQFVELQAKMAEAGQDQSQAFGLMAADLQKLWEMQRLYNVELDATTQAMLDEAEAAGVVGEERMSAEDRMAEGIEYLGEVMKRVGEQLGASFDDLPARARRAADGIGAALDGINPPNLTAGLDIPRDMSPYGPSGGSGVALDSALRDLVSQGRANGATETGTAVADAMAGQLAAFANAIIAGIAGQPIQIQTEVRMDSGAIVGSVVDAVNRRGGGGRDLVTALNEALD